MNNWVYLILIAVLAILALGMLYSRFAARSREKSFHHAPARIMFSSETISMAPMVGLETIPVSPIDEESCLAPESKKDVFKDRVVESPRVENPKSPESDYLDELQEAAAGLAILMRSSPVGRVAPVVFAPEEQLDEAQPESDAVRLEEPLAVKADSAPLHGLVEEVGIPSLEVGEEAVIPVREVLGETVFEMVESIDLELEALERLVSGIETGLFCLGAPDDRGTADREETAEGSRISEAA